MIGSASALWADTRTVAWDPVSGSGIGYRVHYGTQSRVYTTTMDVGGNTTARITFDPGVRYYIAAQAYDDAGQASPLSVELIYDSPAGSGTASAPVISSLSPTSGPVGTRVTISGSNFGQSGSVTFNGSAASPSSWSPNSIVVTVPSGATSGSVVVSAGGLSSAGVSFSVTGTQTGPAQVTSPAPGSTLTASTVQVQWTGGTGITDYWLYVGNTAGGNDLFSRGTTGLSLTVSGLPTDGRTIYLTLFSNNGSWTSRGYSYTAASQGVAATRAELTAPPPSSTLTTSTVTFQWTGGTGVAQYGLHVGTSAGADNLFSRSGVTSLSTTVSGLPTDGRTVYVRLWSEINGSWLYHDYTYATASQGSSAVRAELTTPPPASTLTASTVTFQWTGGTGVTQYGLHLGTSVGANDVFTQNGHRGLSATVSGLPTDGRTLYARLWSEINGSWVYRDYTYTAGSAGSGSGSGTATGPGQIAAPPPGSTLTASTVTFQWTGGTGITEYWLYVGTSHGANNLFSQGGSGLSATVSGLPTDGRALYLTLFSHGSTWTSRDYTYNTASQGASAVLAELTAPPPSSTLTASTVTFQWSGGTGVTQYRLHVGTTPGGNDVFSQSGHGGLSATVAGLPTDGRTLYVRLWSLINGSWQSRDYSYATAAAITTGPGQVTTPAPGSTLTASTVTVHWTGGTGATGYWLYVGSSPGANDLFTQGSGTSLSLTVAALPTDGRVLYFRLFSEIGGVWQYRDYTYTAVRR